MGTEWINSCSVIWVWPWPQPRSGQTEKINKWIGELSRASANLVEYWLYHGLEYVNQDRFKGRTMFGDLQGVLWDDLLMQRNCGMTRSTEIARWLIRHGVVVSDFHDNKTRKLPPDTR